MWPTIQRLPNQKFNSGTIFKSTVLFNCLYSNWWTTFLNSDKLQIEFDYKY